jgi:hypothetical protein
MQGVFKYGGPFVWRMERVLSYGKLPINEYRRLSQYPNMPLRHDTSKQTKDVLTFWGDLVL